MYYEYLYVISSLDWLSVVYGIWDSYVQFGLAVFRYRYSDMMSYDKSIFNSFATILRYESWRFLTKIDYMEIEPALGCCELHRPNLT